MRNRPSKYERRIARQQLAEIFPNAEELIERATMKQHDLTFYFNIGGHLV